MKQPNNQNPEFLKITAIILMLIDHIGAMINHNEILRTIGRLALPLFVFQLTHGFFQSKNHLKNWYYLIIFALISYIPYNIFLNPEFLKTTQTKEILLETWNIFLPLAIGYLLLIILNKQTLISWLTIPILLLSTQIKMDYGWFVPFITVTIYFIYTSPFLKTSFAKNITIFITYIILNTTYAIQVNTHIMQLIAPLGIPLACYLMTIKINIRLPKWFYYLFYPGHLIFLCLIR